MIKPLAKCVAGLDVHKEVVVCTVLKEDSAGQLNRTTKEYKTFRNDLRELSMWLKNSGIELAVMESTGIYWKTVYESLEEVELKSYVVNARHIKNVPGRKTDIMESEWLSELGRCGLLRPGFVPPKDIRELRLVTRYRKKLTGILCAEKNRLHKMLEASGIKLSCVVSSIDGVSAARMIEAILEGKKPEEIVESAVGRLKKKRKELLKAVEDYRISDRCQT
jgi:transposase